MENGLSKNFIEQPVYEGMEFTVKIVQIHAKGDGVAFFKGLAIFIPNVLIGEEYVIRITKVGQKCAWAVIVE